MKNETEFYLRDTRSNVGSSCMFWRINGNGYGSNLDDAEVFNKEDAQRYADRQDHFIPLSKTEVDKLVSIRVDCQYLDDNATSDTDEWVLMREGKWDGNDVYFRTNDASEDSLNYKSAMIYTRSSAIIINKDTGGKYTPFPLSHIKSISRRTIASENISIRKMTQNSGIKYRKPRKRASSGKERFNCPSCGRLVWQYNPYDFEGCKNIGCDEWKAYA